MNNILSLQRLDADTSVLAETENSNTSIACEVEDSTISYQCGGDALV